MSTCPRCDQAELVIDDVDGFLLCPECGFVADEYPLQQQPQGLGTIVLDNDTGKSAARVHQPKQGQGGLQYGTGRLAQPGSSQTRAIKLAQSRIRRLASNLQYPQRITEEACTLIKHVYQHGAVHIGGSAKTVEALVAAVLLAAGRANGAPVSFSDVCHAAETDRRATASYYRDLHASGLFATTTTDYPRPSQTIRAFTLRFAAHILQKQPNRPLLEAPPPRTPHTQHTANNTTVANLALVPVRANGGGSGGGSGVDSGGALVVDAGVAGHMTETDVRAHPFVRGALSLAELVARARIGEGRPPTVMAGAVTVLQAEASGVTHWQGADVASVAVLAHCNKRTLSTAVTHIKEQLLQLAALLPLGALINKDNLPLYLHIIVSATHTIVKLKAQEREQDQERLALDAGPSQGAATQGLLLQGGNAPSTGASRGAGSLQGSLAEGTTQSSKGVSSLAGSDAELEEDGVAQGSVGPSLGAGDTVQLSDEPEGSGVQSEGSDAETSGGEQGLKHKRRRVQES